MLKRLEPEIGCWYENLEQETIFEVVSIDDDDQTVGIQYFDGEIEALDIENFVTLPLKAIDQPEDWSGPYEIDEEDEIELYQESNYNEFGQESPYQFDDFLP